MNKKAIIALVIGLSAVSALATVYKFSNNQKEDIKVSDYKKLPVTNLCASYAIDVNNIDALIGDADYVFLAKVVKYEGTQYRDPVTVETEEGVKEYKDPYTKYSLKVLENIKGELKDDVEIFKAGGLSSDKESILIYEGDELPEEGKTYIFSAYGQEDGSLLVSGTNSNKEVNLKEKSKEDGVFLKYKESLNSQIVRDRVRYESKFSKE